MLYIIGLTLLLPALLTNAEFNKLQWSDCGSAAVSINNIAITPMPIIQPGNAKLYFKANFLRSMQGNLKSDIKVVRTVSGLALPIKCYLIIASGILVGSCAYDDLCTVVKSLLPDSFNPQACPEGLAEYGIDCTCPFKIRSGEILIDNIDLDLPDASTSIATFLASGDFDVTIKTSDSIGSYGCVNIKFSVKPLKPGK